MMVHEGTQVKTRAFTLIELLVVIAIIALLMAIIMPSLSLAKKKAATVACQSNTKNLSLGWYMYMTDNDGLIMSSDDEGHGVESGGQFVGWCGVARDESGSALSISQTTPAVTDEDEIRGIEKGKLFTYVKDPDVYHCPADNQRKSMYDETRVFVSYSVPMCLYGYADTPTNNKQIKRFDTIKQPSTKYVFVETGETRNWNSGHHFVMAAPEYTNLTTWGWWGPMAINHGNSSVLGFSDGHSEVRKWRDPYTIDRVYKLLEQGGTNYGQEYPPPDQTDDINYMAKGWAYRHIK